MRDTTRILSGILCLSTILSAAASGMCTSPGPICVSFGGTPVVFYGKVLSTVPSDEQVPFVQDGKTIYAVDHIQTVRFAVIDGFKGVDGTEAVIHMGKNCGECYYPFVQDSSYLVFAYPDKQRGGFTTSTCSPNHIVNSESDSDLQFLRGLKTAPLGARIFGGVYRPRGTTDRQSIHPNGIAGVSVKLQGQDSEQSRQTDSAGHFEFAGLAPGQYTVAADIPAGLVAPYNPFKVRVVERGCAEVSFSAQNDTSISGTVFGPNGSPLNHVHLEIIPAAKAAHPGPFDPVFCCLYTDEQGHYSYSQIHPGNYIVGIHISRPPDRASPYPRFYSPDTEDVSTANVIKVEYGQAVKDVDIHIQKQLPPRNVDVYVTWPDGTPAKSATVMVEDAELLMPPEGYAIGPGDEPNLTNPTDEAGHTVLHLLVGNDFWVDAMENTGSTGQKCGGPFRVKVDENTPAIKLVIDRSIGNCFAYLNPRFGGR